MTAEKIKKAPVHRKCIGAFFRIEKLACQRFFFFGFLAVFTFFGEAAEFAAF